MKSSNDKNNNLFCDKIEGKNEKAVLILNNKLEENETGGLIIIRNFNKNINLPVFVKTDSGEIPVIDKEGKNVYLNYLKVRYRYAIKYGLENIIIFNKIN